MEREGEVENRVVWEEAKLVPHWNRKTGNTTWCLPVGLTTGVPGRRGGRKSTGVREPWPGPEWEKKEKWHGRQVYATCNTPSYRSFKAFWPWTSFTDLQIWIRDSKTNSYVFVFFLPTLGFIHKSLRLIQRREWWRPLTSVINDFQTHFVPLDIIQMALCWVCMREIPIFQEIPRPQIQIDFKWSPSLTLQTCLDSS